MANLLEMNQLNSFSESLKLKPSLNIIEILFSFVTGWSGIYLEIKSKNFAAS